MEKRTKVAIIGIRGLQVVYSGFETFVNMLVKNASKGKLHYHLYVRRGHQNSSKRAKEYSLHPISTTNDKYFGTLFYSLFATLKSLFLNIDSVLYLGVANTPFIFLQKLKRKRKIIVNVDGIDWKRKRWPFLGKLYLKFCERISVTYADTLIADAKTVYKYYKNTYKVPDRKLALITYGSEVTKRPPGKTLKSFGLEAGKYFVFVGRLVPENCVEDLILATKNLETNYKCVIVGGSYHEDKYHKYLKSITEEDSRVVFTGVLKGKELEEVFSNPFVYVEPKTVGGTHPSLLEAMGYKNAIISKDVEELKETLGRCALYYSKKYPVKTLEDRLKYALDNPQEMEKIAKCAEKRVKKNYNWNSVIEKYHKLFGSRE